MKKKLTAKEKKAAKTAVPVPGKNKKPKKTSVFKTVATIVILLAASASAFYFGLVRIELDPGQAAVFYSKTGGFSEKLIYPGDFVWKIEKLLPSNTKTFIFTITPVRVKIDRQSVLPSGEVYASYLDEAADFSFTLKMDLSYQIKPEALPGLCASEGLRPEGVEQWSGDLSALLNESAVSFIQEQGRKYSGIETISLNFDKLSADLSEALEKKYPAIEIRKITPEKINFPDLELYQSARESYLALMEVKKEVMARSIRSSEAGVRESETRLGILEKYGEVFKKYPELIQFFNISPGLADEWLPAMPETENEYITGGNDN